MSFNARPSPLVPPEISAIICEQVSNRGTLAVLCRTSSLFRAQAQHLLYRSVNLRECSMRGIKSWALSVTRNVHLAERVHFLTLRLPVSLDPSDAAKIAHALSECVNLKVLKVASADGIFNRLPDCKHTWIIETCSFRLHKFQNSYFETKELWMELFWKVQEDIQVLSFPKGTSPLPVKFLPNLVAVHTSNLAGLPPDRPLQRIHTSVGNDLSSLARYAQSLTTLNLTRHWSLSDRDITLSSTTQTIANLLPQLCHLWLVETRKDDISGLPPVSEPAPTKAIQNLSHLETFVFHTRNVGRLVDSNGTQTTAYLMDVPADIESLGLVIMTVCPTLRRTDLGGEVALDEQLNCILTRGATGEIQAEHGTEFDSDAVSMFW
ncbi:hypothetical protein FB45DRAFT_1051264 [Roridomyces roridus]|uniref:Uncharacterized protein n=1 Tax=Roridomyces roridus TaxID=1738132 RepID=A0AAD7CDT2_9AGAR|nr:hypothetical protein FB45DRAFT_1051264 [Roridomyces roridus]